ncbi:MAG: tetratricopeptide repeat protein [Nitrospirae bacterium]|nr:tetratricopeptide repeat protein [Nitrospirota bacterium]
MNLVQRVSHKNKWVTFLIYGLIYGILGLVLYANALDNPFHYDDEHDIVNNHYLQSTENIPKLFYNPIYSSGSERFTHTFRPITYASYNINYALGRLNPAGYHIVNLGLHVGAAFLLCLITALLTGSHGLGGITGMLFLLHPFNSEVVNYITARSSVMATFFYLLSVYAYMRARPPRETEPRHTAHYGRLWLGISFGTFVLAMLSKEVAATVPVTLYLYEITFRRAPKGGFFRAASWGIPVIFLSAVVLPYLSMRVFFYGTPLSDTYARGMSSQLATAPLVLVKMLQLILLPIGLTIEHYIPVMHTILAWPPLAALGVILGLVAAAAICMTRGGRTSRILSFGVAWFFVTQLPTVLIPLGSLLQENRGYLSAAGIIFTMVQLFALLFSEGAKYFPRMRTVQWGVIILVAIIYSGLTYQRNVVWDSDLALWQDAVRKSPDLARAHTFLGRAYRSGNRQGLALAEYQKAISLDPGDSLVYLNLGKLYYDAGQLSQAEKVLIEALRSGYDIAEAHFNLGLVYRRQNRRDLAIQEFLKAVEYNKSFVEGYVILGEEYGLQNRSDLAISYFRKALSIDPGDALSRLNMASLIERQGDRVQAIAEYRLVAEQDLSSPENQFAIGKAREQLKRLGAVQ